MKQQTEKLSSYDFFESPFLDSKENAYLHNHEVLILHQIRALEKMVM